MRRGRHGIEIDQYVAVLNEDRASVEARAGLAVALARLERLDEAALQLDELSIRAPDDLHTAMAHAKIAALEGRSEEALEQLDNIYAARRTLSEEWQLELRRDLATDPAFAGLRKGVRLRSLVHRHLGAAGPQPVR
jgi:predicted Zn-dependent protease